MKRDMDLVRELLLTWEQRKLGDGLEHLDGRYTEEAIDHHIAILFDAGFITMREDACLDDRFMWRMTWAGHEFLDNARDSQIWEKAKAAAASLGGVSIAVLQTLLAELVKRQLGF